jgi:5-methyltetrahydrofolate--homocysteine methyltransferase
MGTQLDVRGIKPSASVNVTRPEVVLEVHRAYREAGAQVLITNTFSANPRVLARENAAEQLERYVAEACRLAREAAAGDAYVAGDIGPTGGFLEPYGALTPEEMRAAFEAPARALASAGVDLFLIETMSDVKEMALAVEACRAVAPDLPVVASMSFDPVGDDFRTNTGVTAEDAARAMAEAGADVVASNCGTVSPEQMALVVQAFRNATDLPVLAQPNAGLPELKAGIVTYNLAPQDYARGLLAVLESGARLLGGCCGTSPAHIKALGEALKTQEN